MRHIFSIIFLFCLGMIANAEVAEFDSASYALGDVTIRSMKESTDSVYPGYELTETELAEFIRGFEENLPFLKYTQDSIKNISFSLGAMEGVFFIDGTHSLEKLVPYDCIYDGLMKIVNHQLTLPQDTVSIMEYMKNLPVDTDPFELPEAEKCRFFTGYGVIKGLQPGLQEYIHEMTDKSQDEAPADYESYAAGFAMMMKNIAPGASRRHSAEDFPLFPADLWIAAREEAQDSVIRDSAFRAFASNIDPECVRIARESAARAGVEDMIRFEVMNALDIETEGARGTVVTNPPYGERLMSREEVEELYRNMGRAFSRLDRWQFYILTSHEDFGRLFGRRPDKLRKLYNGMLPCKLYQFFKNQ